MIEQSRMNRVTREGRPDVEVLVPCRDFAEKTAAALGLGTDRLAGGGRTSCIKNLFDPVAL